MRALVYFGHLEMFVALAWCYDIVTICCISNSIHCFIATVITILNLVLMVGLHVFAIPSQTEIDANEEHKPQHRK